MERPSKGRGAASTCGSAARARQTPTGRQPTHTPFRPGETQRSALHHGFMLLARLAQVSQEVAATSARSRKIALLAELFRDAGADDVPIVIPYLAGRLPQGRLGVGWKVLGRPVAPA